MTLLVNRANASLAPISLKGHLREIERGFIESYLDACGGDKKLTASMLGMTRPTLYGRMKSLGLGAHIKSKTVKGQRAQ